jgi:pimeloyl-ACP methyl ester carboxylesterase
MRAPRLLVLGLLLLAACRSQRPADLAASTPFALARAEGRFVDVHGLSVFTIVTGGGRDVVLLHGNGASAYSWRKVIPALAQHYRVHALDMPGYGFSDKPAVAYDTPWMAEQVVGYLDAMHVARAVLVGNSTGGHIATEVAIRHPERVGALVLLDASGLPEASTASRPLVWRLIHWPVVGPLLLQLPARHFTADGLRHAVADPAVVTEEDIDCYYAPLRTAGGMRAFTARTGERVGPERAAQVATITAPTLVVTGDGDRLVPPVTARRYHELIPNSELVVLEHTGHLPQEEHPERTVAEVTRWADAHP